MPVERGAAVEEAASAASVDAAIASMEKLYERLTGSATPSAEAAHAPIPVETDPARFVEERLEQLLGALAGPLSGLPATSAPPAPWYPALTVLESEHELVLRLDLPGVQREAVRVAAGANLLTITGERVTAGNGHRLRTSERPAGPFFRQVLLPLTVRASEATAELRDGVLEIRVAKSIPEESAARTIPVT